MSASNFEMFQILGNLGYESLAQNAAFRCRFNAEFGSRAVEDEHSEDEGLGDTSTQSLSKSETSRSILAEETEKKLLDLAVMNHNSLNAIRGLFSKSGTVITFKLNCVTLTWKRDELAFQNASNFIKFVKIIAPRVSRINFVKTKFTRADLIQISKVFYGDKDPEAACITPETYLCFKEKSNDNAYATLVEELAPKVRRVEIDDEFVPHLLNVDSDYDYVKVVVNRRLDLSYSKTYFEIMTKSLDVHRLVTLQNLLIFNMDLFRMQANPMIETLCILIGSDLSVKSIEDFNLYIQRLTPNLRKLNFIEGRAFMFQTDRNLDELNNQIDMFVALTVDEMSTGMDEKFELDFQLEISVYTSGKLREQNFDGWLQLLQNRFSFSQPRQIQTEMETRAIVFKIPGLRENSTVTIRIHPTAGDWAESNITPFPHGEPILFN